MAAEPRSRTNPPFRWATMVDTAKQVIQRYSHVNWALADQGLVSGANFLTGVLLARYLGADGYGVYTLGWLVLVFVGSIHAPLITGPMMSIGPAYSEKEAPGYYGAVIVQNIVASISGTILVLIGVHLGSWLLPESGIEQLRWPLAIATFAALWHDFSRRYFFTRERPKMAFTIDAFRYLGQIGLLFGFFLMFPGRLDSTLAMWIIAAAAGIPVVAFLVVISEVAWSWQSIRAVTARHLRSSKWVTASAPMEWLSEYVFFFAVAGSVGTTGVGALRAAQNIVGVAHIMFFGLLNVVNVSAAKHLNQAGLMALRRFMREVSWKAGLATAAICAIFASAPNFWLQLFFGDEFVQYGALVRWWALAYSVHIFVLPLRAGLRALEITRPIFVSRLWAALFALVSASVVVDWFGTEGAVVGVLIAKTIIVLSLWAGAASVFRRHADDAEVNERGEERQKDNKLTLMRP